MHTRDKRSHLWCKSNNFMIEFVCFFPSSCASRAHSTHFAWQKKEHNFMLTKREKNDPHHASFLSFFLFFFFPFCSTKIHLMSCFSLCAHMNCATNEIFWFFRLLFFSSSLLLCLLSFASSIVFFFSFEINWYMTMYGSVTNTI